MQRCVAQSLDVALDARRELDGLCLEFIKRQVDIPVPQHHHVGFRLRDVGEVSARIAIMANNRSMTLRTVRHLPRSLPRLTIACMSVTLEGGEGNRRLGK